MKLPAKVKPCKRMAAATEPEGKAQVMSAQNFLAVEATRFSSGVHSDNVADRVIFALHYKSCSMPHFCVNVSSDPKMQESILLVSIGVPEAVKTQTVGILVSIRTC